MRRQPIGLLSPSRYRVLRECPQRLQRDTSAEGQGHPGPEMLLGTTVHRALELLALNHGSVFSEDPVERHWDLCSKVWTEAIEALEDEGAYAGLESALGPVREWVGLRKYQLLVIHHLAATRAWLRTVQAQGELVPERPVYSKDGALMGVPDLVVRSTTQSWIVDYKTGKLGGDSEFAEAERRRYRVQLLVYAALEAELGWAAVGTALIGADVTISDVPSADEASQVAANMRELRNAWNAHLDGDVEATPGAGCRDCTHKQDCSAFWADDAHAEFASVAEVVCKNAMRLDVQRIRFDVEVKRSMPSYPETTASCLMPIGLRASARLQPERLAERIAAGEEPHLLLDGGRFEGSTFVCNSWTRVAALN